jgi:hypothetical protein
MFAYSFNDMYEWYVDNIDNKDLFEENKDLAVYEIKTTKKYEALSEKKQRALKIQPLQKNQGYLEYFIKQNITDIIKFKSIGTERPNGLYCVIDDSNIYAVFPELKNGNMLADHLTFMSDNVHLTTYQPEPLDPNRGVIWHIPKCKLPEGTQLPLIGYECALLNKMGRFKNMILDTARAYKTYVSGGTKSIGVSKPTKRSPQRVTQPSISGTLEVLLIKYNIKRLQIFCVRKENSWDALVINDGNAESLRFNIGGLRWPSIQKRIIELYMELI